MHAHAKTSAPLPAPGQTQFVNTFQAMKSLWLYLENYKGRIVAALIFLTLAKFANVTVPIVFKHIVDNLSAAHAALYVPIMLLAAYALLRLSSSLFSELKELVFIKVTQQAVRRVALETFQHMHRLCLAFHLERQTGGLTRDIERGTRAMGNLIGYAIYSVLPIFFEIFLVCAILAHKYPWPFATLAVVTLAAYIVWTITITNWRAQLRRESNALDSAVNTRALDSLLNYETVKYFNNERFEARRYDEQLAKFEIAQTKTDTSLSLLNFGQAVIIAVGVSLMMWQAAKGVVQGNMTIGDLVLVNAFLLQVYIPLNFLGVMYRELRQSVTDIERLFALLNENQEIKESPHAVPLMGVNLEVKFDNVHFQYESRRPILQGITFTIPAGKTYAVVGSTGAGKSTLSRLMFRFYDVKSGSITINRRDIREYTQESVRAHIGIVPQDTVLFNDTILYNIQYGRPTASREEVVAAARAAHIMPFIESLPKGFDSLVGERGLKLSGGEKQRVAIARALLKNPPILIFDEATSALDSQTERAIQQELEAVALGRTALVIAHRLSTVLDADAILVMHQGVIIEQGRHEDLLARQGHYSELWAAQQAEEASEETFLADKHSAENVAG